MLWQVFSVQMANSRRFMQQLRRDDRKLTYTRQQADKSIICRKEVITKEQFIDLIQDVTVQILF